jgi:hypothetical protein
MLNSGIIGSDCEISMHVAGHKWKIQQTLLEETWCYAETMRKTIVLNP